jgi:hypothetical protein
LPDTCFKYMMMSRRSLQLRYVEIQVSPVDAIAAGRGGLCRFVAG